jgi:hypothetical protein
MRPTARQPATDWAATQGDGPSYEALLPLAVNHVAAAVAPLLEGLAAPLVTVMRRTSEGIDL